MDGRRTEVTTTKVVWKLNAPANWVEVGKVFEQAKSELGKNGKWDDVVLVECHDEEIWITYDKSLVTEKE